MAEGRLRGLLGALLLVIMAALVSRPAVALEAPGVLVHRLVGGLQAALAPRPGRPNAVASVVAGELVPRLDLDAIARRVTGPRWSALGPAGRSRLKHRMEERIQRLAAAALEEHGGLVRRWLAGARVLPARRAAGGQVLVPLRNPRMAPEEIRVWLSPHRDGWRVAEVAASGVSLAALSQLLAAPAFGSPGP